MSPPAISRVMTTHPHTIERKASLADAHRLMRANEIRHLPVMDQGRLVGVVTQRDLYLLETVAEFDLEGVTVEEAMTEHPFIVTGDVPLDEVAEIMAKQKYGSALVMDREGLQGIFTTTDACRVLAEMLQRDN